MAQLRTKTDFQFGYTVQYTVANYIWDGMDSWGAIQYCLATRCALASLSALTNDAKLGHTKGVIPVLINFAEVVTRASSVFYRPVRCSWSLSTVLSPSVSGPLFSVEVWGLYSLISMTNCYIIIMVILCIARADAPLRANLLLPVLLVPIIVRPLFFSFVFEWFTTACWRAHEANA